MVTKIQQRTRLMKIAGAFLLSVVFLMACGNNGTSTSVGNPSPSTIPKKTITIGKIDADGNSQITVPLALFGSLPQSVQGSTIQVFVNDIIKYGPFSAASYYVSSRQEVRFVVENLQEGDGLKFVIRLLDGTSDTYQNTASAQGDKEAASPASANNDFSNPPIPALVADWNVHPSSTTDSSGRCDDWAQENYMLGFANFDLEVQTDSCTLMNLDEVDALLGEVGVTCEPDGNQVQLNYEINTTLASFYQMDGMDDPGQYSGFTHCLISNSYEWDLAWVNENTGHLGGTYRGVITVSGTCPRDLLAGTCTVSGAAYGAWLGDN